MPRWAPYTPEATRVCSSCQAEKPLTTDNFFSSKRRSGFGGACKICTTARRVACEQRIKAADPAELARRRSIYRLRHKARHPERIKAAQRAADLRRGYGITPEQYDELLSKQAGLCKICGSQVARRLVVDHNHETGQVRGLLCSNCNVAIGLFGENVERMLAAIEYVRNGQ